MKPYRVAVFPMPWTDVPQFVAYVRVYDRTWKGICMHEVNARDDDRAKTLAMREHRLRCLRDPAHKAESDALRRKDATTTLPFGEREID